MVQVVCPAVVGSVSSPIVAVVGVSDTSLSCGAKTMSLPLVTDVVVKTAAGLLVEEVVPGGSAADAGRRLAVIVSVTGVAPGCEPLAVMTIVRMACDERSRSKSRPGASG